MKIHLKRDLVKDRFEIMVHNRYWVQKLRHPSNLSIGGDVAEPEER